MITKIQSFSILQTGKLLAVLYGFFSVILLPVFLIALLVNPKGALPLLVMVVFYPVLGFIGGIIGAALYNLAARFVGGLEINLETQQERIGQM